MAKIYRVICYDGPGDCLAKQLDGSIHGMKEVRNGCTITAATIDSADDVSITIARDRLLTAVATIKPRNGT